MGRWVSGCYCHCCCRCPHSWGRCHVLCTVTTIGLFFSLLYLSLLCSALLCSFPFSHLLAHNHTEPSEKEGFVSIHKVDWVPDFANEQERKLFLERTWEWQRNPKEENLFVWKNLLPKRAFYLLNNNKDCCMFIVCSFFGAIREGKNWRSWVRLRFKVWFCHRYVFSFFRSNSGRTLCCETVQASPLTMYPTIIKSAKEDCTVAA